MLVFGLYFLRMFGQGMMTHVYSTAMHGGMLCARPGHFNCPAWPQSASLLAQQVLCPVPCSTGGIWIILPSTALILVMPFLRYLTRRTALQDGEGIDTVPNNDQVKGDARNTNTRPLAA